MKIRDAVPADVPGIAALERECFSLPWSEEIVASQLTGAGKIMLAAEIEGELRALSARVEGPILALPPGPHRLVMRLRYLEWRAVSDVANGAGYERRYTYKLLEEGERRLAREESAAGGRKEGGAARAEG